MKLKNRKPLGLEALEDRWVPATVQFDGSNLHVSNPLITAGKSALSVIQTSATTFQVKDGAANDGFYAVSGNINVQGNNAQNAVTVSLFAGSGLNGNLSVTTGNGASSVTVDGAGKAAYIAGNTSISTGNGTATVNVGTTNGLANKGSVTASTRSTGANIFQVGGGANSTFVGGQVSSSGFPGVALGGKVVFAGLPNSKDVFAGGVNINFTGNSQNSGITLYPTDTDLGNFTVQGGQGTTDTIILGSVLGTLALNMGNGTNALQLNTNVGPPITIGNIIYISGNGANFFNATGAAGAVTVLGNVELNWGNGPGVFNGVSGGVTKALYVQGNMSVNVGNGNLDATTAPFQGVVNGNLTVNAGNGSNSFTLDVTGGANVGGTFNYTGGNGGNSVTINNTTANTTAMNVRFGNGSANLMTLNAGAPGTGNLTGTIGWGIPTAFVAGVNGYVDNGYVWANPTQLTNVPS